MKCALILRRGHNSVSRRKHLVGGKSYVRNSGYNRLSKGDEDAARAALERRPYYDPGNSTLDFTKPNKKLLEEIRSSSRNRVRLRIEGPAKTWSSIHGDTSSVNRIRREAESSILGAKVSLKSSLDPLSVGDLVLLSADSTLLHLVVAAPSTLASNVYTFINHEGEVTFGTKHHIHLRIPGVFSSKMTTDMNLVAIEKKRPGVAPIGVPDSAFSRERKKSANVDQDTRKTSKKTPESMISPVAPASASLDSGPRDFTVAQASAQLLTDTTVNTFIVPTSAREMYSEYFTTISTAAFSKVTDFANQLDHLHKVLQYDDAGCLIQSARTIPLFELLRLVTTEISSKNESKSKVWSENDNLSAHAFFDKLNKGLGLPLPENTERSFASQSYSASSYIAFISALSKSGRKWKINVQASTRIPVSVDILPLAKANQISLALEYLHGGGTEEISSYIAARINKENVQLPSPVNYQYVVQMLKDFVSGTISKDHIMESLSGSLVRSIDKKLNSEDCHESSQFTHEFARSRAYEILMALEETGDRNPLQWNSALALPGTGTSIESDKHQEFYDFFDSTFKTNINAEQIGSSQQILSKNTNNMTEKSQNIDEIPSYFQDEFYPSDPMACVREDFGDTPVYCIDSETAHEIDDGISIQDFGRRLMVTIHIANPTSYLKPCSSFSQIAFNKGSTVYLPEGPTMMLPQAISKLCGLTGRKQTRTLGIRFSLSKKHVMAYYETLKKDPSAKPSTHIASLIKNAVEQTAVVKFYNVNNFPQGFTYKRVNEVLNDPENIRKFAADELVPGSHEHNLFHLHMIADLIKHFRVSIGSGFGFDSDSSRVKVDYVQSPSEPFAEVENGWKIALAQTGKADTPVISVTQEVNQNKDSKSQHLVSNLMIAANFAGSAYARREGFPIIFRHQELNLKQSVWHEIRQSESSTYLKNKKLTPQKKSQLLSVTTSANYSTFPLDHNMLGLKFYSNLTSPLRRYVDMVNHWKFQDYALLKQREKAGDFSGTSQEIQLLRDKPASANFEVDPKGKSKSRKKKKEKKTKATASSKPIPWSELDSSKKTEFGMRTSDMDYVASHLQACDLRNKQAQRFSDIFWSAKFLRRYFELKKSGQISKPMKFSFLLGSDAKHGDVRAELIGFSSVKTTILQTPFVVEKFANEEWAVGQVLNNPSFEVVKLDFIEGEFTIELIP